MDKEQSKIKSTENGLNIKPANCGYTVLATVFEKHILHFDIGDSVYLKTDPELQNKLAQRRATDTVFAKSASAQLNYVFQQSPYFEPVSMR